MKTYRIQVTYKDECRLSNILDVSPSDSNVVLHSRPLKFHHKPSAEAYAKRMRNKYPDTTYKVVEV